VEHAPSRTALAPGATGCGPVYKPDSAGNEAALHAFTGGPDGAHPLAGVIRDMAGSLYGTAVFGGKYNDGVVFRLEP
jgi:uncharacterized repeat protein (TIGR03803 family)